MAHEFIGDRSARTADQNHALSGVAIPWEAPTAIGINLIHNGSFEGSTDTWDAADATLERTKAWAHSGEWSMRIVPTGPEFGVQLAQGDAMLGLAAGASYRMSMYVKPEAVPSDPGDAALALYIVADGAELVAFAAAERTVEAHKIEMAFTIPPGTTSMLIMMGSYSGTHTIPTMVDSVMITPADYYPAPWGVEYFDGDQIVTESSSAVGLVPSWQGFPMAGAPWAEQRRNYIPDPRFTTAAFLSGGAGVNTTLAEGQLILVTTDPGVAVGRLTGPPNRIAKPAGASQVTFSAHRQLGGPITRTVTGGSIGLRFFDAEGDLLASVMSPMGTNAAGAEYVSCTGVMPGGTVAIEVAFYGGEGAGEVVAWMAPLLEFVGTVGTYFDGAFPAEGLARYRFIGTLNASPSVLEMGSLIYGGGQYATPSFLHLQAAPAGANSPGCLPIRGDSDDQLVLHPLVPGVNETYALLDGPSSGATGRKYLVSGFSESHGDRGRAIPEQSGGIEIVYPSAPSTLATRKGLLTIGHTSAKVAVPMGWNLTCRAAFVMPCNAQRFRIHYRNIDYLNDIPGEGTISIHSTWLGEAEKTADGTVTGAFTKPPTQVAWDNVFMVDGAEGVTDWILPEQFALQGGKTMLLSYGVSFWTDGTFSVSSSSGWIGGNLLTAGEQGVIPDSVKIWPLFNVWIEYEHITTQPILAVVGHSLNGAGNVDPESHPWNGEYESWHQTWALRNNAQTMNLAVGGSWTYNFADDSPKWNYFDSAGVTPDIIAFFACSSNIAGGMPLQSVKDELGRLITKARAKWPGVKVIAHTEPGRVALDGNPATQAAMADYNTWLRTKPHGIDQVIDVAPLLSDPSNPNRLDPAIDADGEHFTTEGHLRIVREMGNLNALVTRYRPPKSHLAQTSVRGPRAVVFTSNESSFKVRLWNGADANSTTVWSKVAIRDLGEATFSPWTERARNLFPNPAAIGLVGFSAVPGQAVLSHTGTAARWTISSPLGVAISSEFAPATGTAYRLLIRARANRALIARPRILSSLAPPVQLTTEWKWFSAVITAGNGPSRQTGFLLESGAGHVSGDWVEIDRVLYAVGYSGEWFSGNSITPTATARTRWLGTAENSVSVYETRQETG